MDTEPDHAPTATPVVASAPPGTGRPPREPARAEWVGLALNLVASGYCTAECGRYVYEVATLPAIRCARPTYGFGWASFALLAAFAGGLAAVTARPLAVAARTAFVIALACWAVARGIAVVWGG